MANWAFHENPYNISALTEIRELVKKVQCRIHLFLLGVVLFDGMGG